MLPEPNRLHCRADFSRTVRRGQRSGRRDLVVHAFVHTADPAAEPTEDELIRVGGPRFGLIVSKAVGNAVIRHRVARRLRHICAEMRTEIPVEADIVIRALPGAATADSAELLRQLRGAARKLGLGVRPVVRSGEPA
ncbi:ribonuclease P protein component [Nocardia cyriacigeorgica]|uniref:Ribonuclease P protein component n=1 Tax=Nocardia cyriacigeorgica TaxID=135487 RepID=A0A6P1CMK6_9NOCA|nr:ribonuclease P protein component [Nocardia cyriacigeorgica]MBF6084443.1 ribonuclease P protein component [Nocardia cyriacigeorgica]MBF6286967.1 ribonuclease P protein component [Nocardia cyriacigeorgica]MBF6425109.1 ribonuclease P protein component [Nocardia cyriacigeorgica]NEW31425.1 ribonuclease P protein component [Nocardia cyriacigeorgica]